MWPRAIACLTLALASALVLPAVPSYDPLAWLIWGRELAGGSLDTAEGPAWKPLPVALTTLLAPLGPLAAPAWVVLARAGALLAVVLAWHLGRSLCGESRAASALAAAALALTPPLLAGSAAGASEGLLLALGLGAFVLWREGRGRAALALGVGCALIRTEAWPFLAAAAVFHVREHPEHRRLLVGGALAIPLLWFGPEAIGSGEPLRSGARGRMLEPGQPGLAELPALESATRALGLMLVPALSGVALLIARPRRHPAALLLAAVGTTWIAEVALMAQLGYSGEERYSAPGVALLGIAGTVGLVAGARALGPTPRRLALAGAALALGLAAVGPARGLGEIPDALRQQERMYADLDRAIDLAGGRERLLRCGAPNVGRYRGPLLAYRLGVEKRRVDFSPDDRGTAFVSRLTGRPGWEPGAPGRWPQVARAGTWRVHSACGEPTSN